MLAAMKPMAPRLLLLLVIPFALSPVAASEETGDVTLQLEGGAVGFQYNDVRIPGDTGTKFDISELTGDGPDPYLRAMATWQFADNHALRLTWAPLESKGTDLLDEPVDFRDLTFAAGVPTRARYRFDTWRLAYRWTFRRSEKWDLAVGAAVLVRDAEISLAQAGQAATKDDLGVVPLLHFRAEYHLGPRSDLVLDFEGAAAPQGRALDLALKYRRRWASGWEVSAGYRTLEGGADNDDVYTFAWLHHALVGVGYRF